jgi:thiamine biosynthesis lipoprotein
MRAIIITALALALACTPEASQKVLARDWTLMGTSVSLQIYDSEDFSLLERSRELIEGIEAKMTNWDEGSEVMEINRMAGLSPVPVSPETLAVIKAAMEIARLSNGAFDPTIGPVVDLWGITTENPRVPEDQELASALSLVDWRDVEIDGGTVFLPEPGMVLDLGAIAKGYAADQLAEFLVTEGVSSAILNFGGNVYVLGEKPDGSLWRVGIQDPEKIRNQTIAVAEVGQTSMVTSGTYERFFVDEASGKTYHHIIDPENGFPVDNGLLSVTIISGNSMNADGLSTACFVLGLERGLSLLESLPDAEGVFITTEREFYFTSGARGAGEGD